MAKPQSGRKRAAPRSFDNLCKYLAETYPEAFVGWLVGHTAEPVRVLKTELSIEPIRADSVLFLALQDEILHIEFQTGAESEPELDLREADYAIRLYRLYHKAVRQVVVVLKPTRTPIPSEFRMGEMIHRYRVVKLWEEDPAPFLQNEALLPLAVLAYAEQPMELLGQVAQRVNQIADTKQRRELLACTQILAGLRFDESVIQTLFRGGMMKESVIYQAILREGEQKGRREGLQEGEQKGRQEGLQEGLQAGEQRQLLRILQHRFDAVTPGIQTRLRGLSAEQLEDLVDVALTVSSLEDFVRQIPPAVQSL